MNCCDKLNVNIKRKIKRRIFMKNKQTSIFDLAKEEKIDIKENVLQVI